MEVSGEEKVMKTWIDEQTGCKMCEADCVDEWLSDIYNIGYDYDGYRDAKNLMELINELLEMVCKARDCLWQGRLFGVYGAPVRKDKKEEAKIDNDIVRDCHNCVYEVGCHGNPVGCKSYKRDAPDGGYYG